MDFVPINFAIIKHPINWVIILLMLVIAGAAGHLVLTLVGMEPNKNKVSAYDDLPAGQTPADTANFVSV